MTAPAPTPCLWVSESFVNATENSRFGDSEPYETDATTRGELFRQLQAEYGRCISRLYVDRSDYYGRSSVSAVGWVFQSRQVYADARPDHYTPAGRPVYAERDHYTREVWVTVLTAPDTVTRERHYAYADA